MRVCWPNSSTVAMLEICNGQYVRASRRRRVVGESNMYVTAVGARGGDYYINGNGDYRKLRKAWPSIRRRIGTGDQLLVSRTR